MLCCPAFRKVISFTLAAVVAGGFLMSISSRPSADEASEKEKLLRHVVMFQFKDTSSEEDVQAVVDAFRALPGKIPQIADFEWGTNNSPENHDEGLTHCFTLTFKSEEDRAVYLPHPDHKAFGKVLGPHLEKVVVIDYWAQD